MLIRCSLCFALNVELSPYLGRNLLATLHDDFMIIVSCCTLYCEGAYGTILFRFDSVHAFFQLQGEESFCFISQVTESFAYGRDGGVASFYYIYLINERTGKQF